MKKNHMNVSRIITALLVGTMAITTVLGFSAAYGREPVIEDTEEDPNYKPAPIIEGAEYNYQINDDGTITIAEYTGSDEVIEIPTEIDGYTVSSIGYQSFSYEEFTSLTIPEGITTIEARAFEYCSISDSLVLPAGITIQDHAFGYAKLPSVVTLPEGAVLEKNAFYESKIVSVLFLEPDVTIKECAFSYNDSLIGLVCSDGAILEDRAFEYCENLRNVIMSGNFEIRERTFDYCDNVTIAQVGEDELSFVVAMLQQTGNAAKNNATYQVGDLKFSTNTNMQKSTQAEYDLFLVDYENLIMVGGAVMPSADIDFEDDEAILGLLESVPEDITVDNYYKVKVCGYPGLWINLHTDADEVTGSYLYIDAVDQMYYLMFLNVMNDSRTLFVDIVNSITIGSISEGTDLSEITE